MKKFLQKKLKDQKGMTLIELLAVIVIIAIIAAIAIPAIGNIIENSRYSAVKSDATNVLTAANIYFTDTPEDTDNSVSVTELINAGFLESAGEIPGGATIVNGNPLELTAADVKFSGSKTVDFENATIADINGDDTKGSDADADGNVIGTPASSG